MPDISMPHRYLVRWQDGELCADYEVETLADRLVFYAAGPRVAGGDATPRHAAAEVETWLRSRFAHVEVDHSPKPSF